MNTTYFSAAINPFNSDFVKIVSVGFVGLAANTNLAVLLVTNSFVNWNQFPIVLKQISRIRSTDLYFFITWIAGFSHKDLIARIKKRQKV